MQLKGKKRLRIKKKKNWAGGALFLVTFLKNKYWDDDILERSELTC